MYLSGQQVHQLLASVSNLSAAGSQLGLDLINAKGVEYGPYKGYFQFGTDTPEQLLAQINWKAQVLQPGDEGAHFGRYTEQVPPRDIPDVMRVFLVTAQTPRLTPQT